MSEEGKILWAIEISWLLQETFGLKPYWKLSKRIFCKFKLKYSQIWVSIKKLNI